ncbi:MAG: hypothetical protein E7773_14260 [Sphingomonas sp.]|uniref:hypothetical protein n=1 Tax=Sphingomonas sp. TaxID=28214 RepID=UPI0012267A73|nr:hypothetical protein [Sphingomonas sp.]THD34818.1 MAG: hypothetical protein E7773_14260 [Sphingomonas sp.]
MDRNYHDKGQTDRSNGEYDNPHGLIDSLVNFCTATDDEWKADIKESEDYDKGWNHTDKQLNKGFFGF